MYLIDTDILIWVLRENKKYQDFLKKIAKKEPLSISTITIAEVYKNIYPEKLVKTENLIQEFLVHDVTSSIAKQAGFYWQQYAKRLKKLNITDCLIAATASINNATLVSLNIKHFPMKDIQILNPLKS